MFCTLRCVKHLVLTKVNKPSHLCFLLLILRPICGRLPLLKSAVAHRKNNFMSENMDNTIDMQLNSPSRLTKQEKKSAKYECRREKLKEKKGNAKVKLKEKLQFISHEEKLVFGMNKKLEKLRKTENAINAMNSNVKVCIDLSFNDLNSPREQRSLVKQCTLAYAAVRNSAHGVALHISSLQGDVGDSLDKVGIEQWHIQRHASSAIDVFGRDSIVVLSPDADDILQEFDPTKVYIIGGIVDRTVCSNLTLDRASEQGVVSLRLPVKEFFPQAQSHVINIDQVVSLFCFFQETKDWKLSMERAMPVRRQSHNDGGGLSGKASSVSVQDEELNDDAGGRGGFT